jgi:hypothetical protein
VADEFSVYVVTRRPGLTIRYSKKEMADDTER